MRAKLTAQVRKRRASHPDIPAASAADSIGIVELRQALTAFAD